MILDINLLTKEERQEQIKNKVVKTSSVLAVIFLIIVGFASAYFFAQIQSLKSKIKQEDQTIETMRSQIEKMAPVEITARNLYQKYTIIKGIFSGRVYTSYLLRHFESKIPGGVTVDTFTPEKETDISITGNAPNYIAVSDFLKNLIAKEDVQVFTSARLSSVTLNSADRTVKFAIVISYDPEVLKFNE
jgi:Tfp pilus assembly protein PilN